MTITTFVLALVSLFAAPCFAQDLSFAKSNGFILEAPHDDQLTGSNPDERTAMFGKRISRGHTVVYLVQTGDLPGAEKATVEMTLAAIVAQKEKLEAGVEYSQHNVGVQTVNGAQCVRTTSRGVQLARNLMLILNGVICLHPKDHSRFILVQYSQRLLESQVPSLAVPLIGEEFIKSLKFE